MKWVLVSLASVAMLLCIIALLLIAIWRTGEIPQPALRYEPPSGHEQRPTRIWIDADAACGTGERRDPDDCLALFSLARARDVEIVGISTTFGNAPVSVTDRVTRELVRQLHSDAGGTPLHVYEGCGAAAARCLAEGGSVDAHVALASALHAGVVDYVALGPLTNLAAVLTREPALAIRITRVIAVMGRRPGHRFHPSENRGVGAMLFGHGPIFRDLNAVMDSRAVDVVLGSGVPIVLIPYAAARHVSLRAQDLDRISGSGVAGWWVADRSRSWLTWWQRNVGLDGFYPFDLMAAAYVRDAGSFRCARVAAWVGDDEQLGWFSGGPALLVAQQERTPDGALRRTEVRYCDVVEVTIDELFPEKDSESKTIPMTLTPF